MPKYTHKELDTLAQLTPEELAVVRTHGHYPYMNEARSRWARNPGAVPYNRPYLRDLFQIVDKYGITPSLLAKPIPASVGPFKELQEHYTSARAQGIEPERFTPLAGQIPSPERGTTPYRSVLARQPGVVREGGRWGFNPPSVDLPLEEGAYGGLEENPDHMAAREALEREKAEIRGGWQATYPLTPDGNFDYAAYARDPRFNRAFQLIQEGFATPEELFPASEDVEGAPARGRQFPDVLRPQEERPMAAEEHLPPPQAADAAWGRFARNLEPIPEEGGVDYRAAAARARPRLAYGEYADEEAKYPESVEDAEEKEDEGAYEYPPEREDLYAAAQAARPLDARAQRAFERRRTQDSIAEEMDRRVRQDMGEPTEATLRMPPEAQRQFDRLRRMAISSEISPSMLRGLSTASPLQHKIISALKDYSEEVGVNPLLFTNAFENVKYDTDIDDTIWKAQGNRVTGPHSLPPRDTPIEAWGGVERRSDAGPAREPISFEGSAAGEYAQLPRYINDISRASMARAYAQSKRPFPFYPGKKVADQTPEERAASDSLLSQMQSPEREKEYEDAQRMFREAGASNLAAQSERDTESAMRPSAEGIDPYMRAFDENIAKTLRKKSIKDYEDQVLEPLEGSLISRGLRNTGARKKLIRDTLHKFMDSTENRIAMLRHGHLQDALRHAAHDKDRNLQAANVRSTAATRDAVTKIDSGRALQGAALAEEAQRLHLADMLRMSGEQKRNLEQNRINTAMTEWDMAHRFPLEQTERLLNMARAAPTNTAGMRFTPVIPSTTPVPSLHRQLAGLGLNLGGNLMEMSHSKKGGVIRQHKAEGGEVQEIPEMTGEVFEKPELADRLHLKLMQDYENSVNRLRKNKVNPLYRFLQDTGATMMSSENPTVLGALGEGLIAGGKASREASAQNDERILKSTALKGQILDILKSRLSDRRLDRKLEYDKQKDTREFNLEKDYKGAAIDKMKAEKDFIAGGKGLRDKSDEKQNEMSIKQGYKLLDKNLDKAKFASKAVADATKMERIFSRITTGPSYRNYLAALDSDGLISKTGRLWLQKNDPQFLKDVDTLDKMAVTMAGQAAKAVSPRVTNDEFKIFYRRGVPNLLTQPDAAREILKGYKDALHQDLHDYSEAYKQFSPYGRIGAQYPSIKSLTSKLDKDVFKNFMETYGDEETAEEDSDVSNEINMLDKTDAELAARENQLRELLQ